MSRSVPNISARLLLGLFIHNTYNPPKLRKVFILQAWLGCGDQTTVHIVLLAIWFWSISFAKSFQTNDSNKNLKLCIQLFTCMAVAALLVEPLSWKLQVVGSIPELVNLTVTNCLSDETLTLSQTSPGFYVSAVQVFWKHCGKRRNCS